MWAADLAQLSSAQRSVKRVVQVAEALLVWAADLAQLADAAGARPADLAAEADATSVLELLRRM